MKEILAPEFLVNRIHTIAVMLGAVCLVVFSDFVLRTMVFPLADFVKGRTHQTIKKVKVPLIPKYLSEGLATAIFIIYCYIGSGFLSEYIFEPILLKLKDYILLICLGLFLVVSYLINTKNVRRRFMKV